MFEYQATCRKVVDGDTLDLDIDLGLDIHIRERCRLAGIDAFETRGPERADGLRAKHYMEHRVLGEPLIVQTIKNKKGKYGRYLIEIFLDGANINHELIELGHAREWES